MKFSLFNRTAGLRAGQHAVVTGGSSGLGLALSHRFAACGLSVTLVARDKARLATAAAELSDAVPSAVIDYIAVDVADNEALEAAFGKLPVAVDLLVNSAGIIREGYFEKLDAADFHDVMNINFFGTVNCVRATLPRLKRQGGRIVNIASVAGLTGVFGYTSYCAAKHALVGFTDALRFELEPQGVRVQVVCPGEFDSPMVDDLDRTRTPENRRHTLTIPKLGIEDLADATVAGIDSGQRLIVPGAQTRLLVTAQRLAPSIANAIARQRISTAYRGPGV
ncbi:SDR family oxidoreductase [Nocardia fluminea]|uniref:SDR family oxidoreductase n=1 Tax=Nocardia fluminea TaxID=134984 RepID=UPI003403824E